MEQPQDLKSPKPQAEKSKAKEMWIKIGKKSPLIITIVLCVLLIPILIVNSVLIVKSYANPDAVPSIFGVIPLPIGEDLGDGIHKGDTIFAVVVDAEDIAVGDIILFQDKSAQNKDSIIIQKVDSIKDDGDGTFTWQTKPLGTPAKGDSSTTTAKSEYLVGRYEGARLAGLGAVTTFMSTVPGIIVCIGVPLGLLIAYEFLNQKKKNDKSKEDTATLMAELEALRAEQAARQQAESTETVETVETIETVDTETSDDPPTPPDTPDAP